MRILLASCVILLIAADVPPDLAASVLAKWPNAKLISGRETARGIQAAAGVTATLDGKSLNVHLTNPGSGWRIESYELEIPQEQLPPAVIDAVRKKHPRATI